MAVFVAVWIITPLPKAHAMMQESSSGKVVQIWGGKFGYESRAVFWTDLGDFRSQHLYLGPVELSHTDAKTSPARYVAPESIGLRAGTWSTVVTLDSRRRNGFWIGLILVLTVSVALWRKRIADRRSSTVPASDGTNRAVSMQ